MKGGKAHVIPLSGPPSTSFGADNATDREYIFGVGQGGFQGWSAARAALDKRLIGPRPDWTLHDFRRMASTVLNGALKVQPHVVERVLAHVPRGMARSTTGGSTSTSGGGARAVGRIRHDGDQPTSRGGGATAGDQPRISGPPDAQTSERHLSKPRVDHGRDRRLS